MLIYLLKINLPGFLTGPVRELDFGDCVQQVKYMNGVLDIHIELWMFQVGATPNTCTFI